MFRVFGTKRHPFGPDCSKVQEHHLDLSGIRIRFETPPNNHRLFPFEARSEQYNIYDDSLFWRDDDSGEPASELVVFIENWEFRSLFTALSRIGWLQFSIRVIKNESCGSLFNHENWMHAINQRLNYNIGPQSGRWKGEFLSVRKDWQIELLDQSAFIRYSDYKKGERGFIDVSQSCMAPITDRHYIIFAFSRYIFTKNTSLDRIYDELIRTVFSTVRIEWSSDALRQQAEAKAKWPDQKLPESLPELSWSDEEWLACESDDQRDLRELAEKFRAIDVQNGELKA